MSNSRYLEQFLVAVRVRDNGIAQNRQLDSGHLVKFTNYLIISLRGW